MVKLKVRNNCKISLDKTLCYCSDFRTKRNIHARCGFFIQSVFTVRNTKFQQNFLYPIEDIEFLSSNVKR